VAFDALHSGTRGTSGDQLFDALRAKAETLHLGRTERWLSLVAGGALAAYGFKRRGALGGAAALGAAALLYRGSTGHWPACESMGIERAKGTGRLADSGSDTRYRLGGARGITVDETVTIRRPHEEVYRFWRDFENLPRFMTHLRSVAVRDAGVSHWVARGPGGLPVAWDARVINDIDNELIAWQSLEGSTVATAGSVHFTETADGTKVHVRFQYEPPAGSVGASIATMFGVEPRQTVREDLDRLKQMLET
jgi:uncharacterized membrane protein